MKCPYCGSENDEKAVKCSSCHALLMTDNEELLNSLSAPAAVSMGAAQAQVQQQVQPEIEQSTPVLEKEKANFTQQFIEEREKARAAQQNAQPTYQYKPSTGVDTTHDQLWGVLSYVNVLPALIAYFVKKDKMSSFLKTHVNQGIILGIAAALNGVISQIFPGIGTILGLVIFALAVMGIYYVAKGEDKKLPIIGDYQIFK